MRLHEERVLEWINETRVKYGIGEPLAEMPPDMTVERYRERDSSISAECPVAVALDQRCGSCTIVIDGVWIRFPEYVSQFIQDHDGRIALVL